MMIPVIFQIRGGPFQIRSRRLLPSGCAHSPDRGAAVAQRAYDEAVPPRAPHNSQVFGGGGVVVRGQRVNSAAAAAVSLVCTEDPIYTERIWSMYVTAFRAGEFASGTDTFVEDCPPSI